MIIYFNGLNAAGIFLSLFGRVVDQLDFSATFFFGMVNSLKNKICSCIIYVLYIVFSFPLTKFFVLRGSCFPLCHSLFVIYVTS